MNGSLKQKGQLCLSLPVFSTRYCSVGHIDSLYLMRDEAL